MIKSCSQQNRISRVVVKGKPRDSVLGLRPPGFEFRILCLEGSVISIISPSSGGSPDPIQPVCAQKWPKAQFISFCQR